VQRHGVRSRDEASRTLIILDLKSDSHISESVINGSDGAGGFGGWGTEVRSHGLVTGLSRNQVGVSVLKVGGQPG
jgi:hypothetical protein